MPASGSTDQRAWEPPAPPTRLRRRLLAWFRTAARDLPWRRRRSLYGTWIAEVMLQQTTVATVSRRWPAFLRRFPDVTALAAATEESVLAAWSGLGYYGRARRLHAAARQLAVAGGGLPRTAAAWRRLPGVGPYTAAAVASLGAGEAVAAVDTNVRRVLARLLCADAGEAAGLTPRAIQAIATRLLDRRRPGAWNEALMELGALVCLPAAPQCPLCPWRESCRAAAAGTTAVIPPPPVRKAPLTVHLSLLVLHHGDAVLLLPPGTPAVMEFPAGAGPASPPAAVTGGPDPANLWRGMWGLPATTWSLVPAGGEVEAVRVSRGWRRWLSRRAPGLALGPPAVVAVRHSVTRYRLRVVVCMMEAGERWAPAAGRWVRPEAAGAPPVSSLTRRALLAVSGAG